MASPTNPTHGLHGNIYWLRENNFRGANATNYGLNDLTWGAASGEDDSSIFEVTIDAEAEPDTFKWRVKTPGGEWSAYTETVAITGSSQDLVSAATPAVTQAITFGATTGHMTGDSWFIGNFHNEAATNDGADAQVTDATARLINLNNPPTWSDTGSEDLLRVNYSNGTATFSDNVTVVTVDGGNGFIYEDGLQKLGHFKGWNFNVNIDLADSTANGDTWKKYIVGQSGFTVSIERMFIGNHTLWDAFRDAADGTTKRVLLQLFSYDPDQDQTGDHWDVWCTINSYGISTATNDVVKSNTSFTGEGAAPAFTANA